MVESEHVVSAKFRVPVSRSNRYVLVFFLGGTIFWILLCDVVLLDVMLSDPAFLLAFGIAMPIIWFLIFVLAVKTCFFNYHEITEKNLVISVPPRRISVPLEEIVEIKSDVGSIETEFGESRWDVKYEAYEPGQYYLDLTDLSDPLKYKEEYSVKGRSIGKKIEYGTSYWHFDGITRIRSVFNDKNLVLIRAKDKEIITNVPDAQKFVAEALKAMRLRRSRAQFSINDA